MRKKELENDISGLNEDIVKQKKIVEETQDKYKNSKEDNKNDKEIIAEKEGKI